MAVRKSASDGGPSVLIEQLCEGLPYSAAMFPDAFEVAPKSWPFDAAARRSARSRTPLVDSTRAAAPDATTVVDETLRLMMRRGMHEEQRVRLRRRVQQRRALQLTSGQACVETAQLKPCAAAIFAQHSTTEQKRREEMRDVPHTLWAAEHSAAFAWYREQRRCCLETLRARRQERVELEHYAGSSRDKLLLSRRRHLHSPSRGMYERENDEFLGAACDAQHIARDE